METRQDVAMIMAGSKSSYVRKGYEKMGIQIVIPYKDFNLLLRCMREAWFRLHLPGRSIWYNDEIKNIKTQKICIRDPLITPGFVEWVCDLFPQKSIMVTYSNRTNRATVLPTDVKRDNLTFSSYDKDDCEKYNMRFNSPKYMRSYAFGEDERKQPEYDVVYLGRDKGRAEKLFAIEKEFEELGLKTYFHICADRELPGYKKKYHKPLMPYEDYIELLKRTKAHLNIVPEGQRSVTQRELETIFDRVKCITNNKGIKDFELYDPTRYFVIDEDEISQLPLFLESEFKPVSEDELSKYEDKCIF